MVDFNFDAEDIPRSDKTDANDILRERGRDALRAAFDEGIVRSRKDESRPSNGSVPQPNEAHPGGIGAKHVDRTDLAREKFGGTASAPR